MKTVKKIATTEQEVSAIRFEIKSRLKVVTALSNVHLELTLN